MTPVKSTRTTRRGTQHSGCGVGLAFLPFQSLLFLRRVTPPGGRLRFDVCKKPMIDRTARNQVTSAFEAFLDDRITAFEFDDRLQEIESEDRTVNEIIRAAWFHYDDCKDHKVCLSKAEWDYFQRLLLILGSDAEFTSSPARRWSWDHGVAWLALVAFVGIASVAGWGWRAPAL